MNNIFILIVFCEKNSIYCEGNHENKMMKSLLFVLMLNLVCAMQIGVVAN